MIHDYKSGKKSVVPITNQTYRLNTDEFIYERLTIHISTCLNSDTRCMCGQEQNR